MVALIIGCKDATRQRANNKEVVMKNRYLIYMCNGSELQKRKVTNDFDTKSPYDDLRKEAKNTDSILFTCDICFINVTKQKLYGKPFQPMPYNQFVHHLKTYNMPQVEQRIKELGELDGVAPTIESDKIFTKYEKLFDHIITNGEYNITSVLISKIYDVDRVTAKIMLTDLIEAELVVKYYSYWRITKKTRDFAKASALYANKARARMNKILEKDNEKRLVQQEQIEEEPNDIIKDSVVKKKLTVLEEVQREIDEAAKQTLSKEDEEQIKLMRKKKGKKK